MGIRSLSSASISTGAKRSKFWDQITTAGYYDLIASTNVTTATATITFSNIPQTYSHLQIRASVRTDNNSLNYSSLYMAPNGVVSASYTVHQFYTDGASGPSASGRGAGSDYNWMIQNTAGNTAPTYHFGSALIDLYNYTNTNHYKTMRSMGGVDTTTPGNGWVFWNSGTYTADTNAITSLTFACDGNFGQYSNVSLYGIK